MTDSGSPLGQEPVVTSQGLAELLRAQHTELRTLMCRVPLLHGGAREDVFLRVRRLLAVHLELESVLLSARLLGTMPDHFRLDREVEAAERGGRESIDFDAALARLAVAFLRHVEVQEALSLAGPLSSGEQETVATAVRLWEGEGDAFLGNAWQRMVAVASEQLSAIDDGASRI